ncbi:calcipressin [Schizosaccharomyces japonicus yFS275]|uniref:Calcipressin n=1 Tax=Schizosaccharomyces japonicus (strain yFS275 / FY16936) TaxID=402676 RepID=B6K7Z7_SCHJY|nr:calcipressin [Schizosaccharomyces japonicus yFS275]EEB09651.1 calcipressin [Schizosaccharomyces japonicus yFS275]
MLIFSANTDCLPSLEELIQKIPLTPKTITRLKGLGKILVEYETKDDERSVQQAIDGTFLQGGRPVRCEHDDTTEWLQELRGAMGDSLVVPELEKNWLISPPCSPPADWQPVREESPNARHLAEDLQARLNELGELRIGNSCGGPEIIISAAVEDDKDSSSADKGETSKLERE